eukprot:ctg_874.g430
MPPSRRERVSATLPCFLVPFIAWRRSANLLSPVTETGRRWPQPPPPLLPRLARPLARPTGALRLEAAAAGKRKDQTVTLTFENRKAHFSYDILSTLECGIELVGTEVKSVRAGRLNLRDAYARVDKHRMELMLHNAHISIHETTAKYFNHDPTRVRERRHDAGTAAVLLQQARGVENAHRGGARQETARQTRVDQEARDAARARLPHQAQFERPVAESERREQDGEGVVARRGMEEAVGVCGAMDRHWLPERPEWVCIGDS